MITRKEEVTKKEGVKACIENIIYIPNIACG